MGRFLLYPILYLLAAGLLQPAAAQAPAWGTVTTGSSVQPMGTSQTRTLVADAAGNLFVTGNFSGQVTFGTTTLTSVGDYDLFVAKYVPATDTWAWALGGGGTRGDSGFGLALNGSSVYVAGFITNNRANASQVVLGGSGTTPTTPQYGTSTTAQTSGDILVAKYTDNGTSATLNWTQVGGGTGDDRGLAIAVSGASVYVGANITNTLANASAVVFGGSGTVAGTIRQNGASTVNGSDMLIAKYTDNGASATLNWTQVGGGTANDAVTGLAVVGSSLYVASILTNSLTNENAVLLGGSGTTPGTIRQYGASATSSLDLLLSKYTDNGPSATLVWNQVGGGTSNDQAGGLSVSGTSIYLAAGISNTTSNGNAVVFGGSGTMAGTSYQYGASPTRSLDLLVAKYVDNGPNATLAWTQVGGGTGLDYGTGVAVRGSAVYVSGILTNTDTNDQQVLFGGSGLVAGTAPQSGASPTASIDVVVARYTDNGTSATLGWTQVAGGTGTDYGFAVALAGDRVYATGNVVPVARFGSLTVSSPISSSLYSSVNFLASLRDPTLLSVRSAASARSLLVFPNPLHHAAAALSGATPGAAIQVFDALGRRLLEARADYDGAAQLLLPAELPAGVYSIRSGLQGARLVVE